VQVSWAFLDKVSGEDLGEGKREEKVKLSNWSDGKERVCTCPAGQAIPPQPGEASTDNERCKGSGSDFQLWENESFKMPPFSSRECDCEGRKPSSC
jgi:hypothetical protein